MKWASGAGSEDRQEAGTLGVDGLFSLLMQVGEVSGIMTDLFTDAWDYFKVRHPVLTECQLKLETIKAYTFCENCGKTYETVRFGKTCPYCQSGETYLVTGNQCIIKEIEAEENEEGQ